MSRRFVPRVLFCASLALLTIEVDQRALAQAPLVAPGEALSPEEQKKLFHLPAGFEIQLFASEPTIHKPMNITFDAAGRLFVTDTLEYPYPAKQGPGNEGTVPRDTVKILVDRDGDGSADGATTFVDGLNIPLGVMPVPRGVLVYGIGGVMRCLDDDGDGRADTRDVVYGNFGHRDTHGMVNSFTRGLDGWLYACHGFANDSAPQGSDSQAIRMNSGNTLRMRLDGSHVEYFTHGQVNPFGLAFDPLGNLYSADCHTKPIYMLLRGAYYPSFGKAHDGLGFGPTMIAHDHGSTGIGGIAYYAAEQFPPSYRDTILIGNPVTGKVNHDRLVAHGSTYEAVELPDFVTCDDPWFRPVNLQVGPDGALYIADFYNRIIGHYEVPLEHPGRDRHRGRIWRVVYTGRGVDSPLPTAPAKLVNVSRASLVQLLEHLDHANLTVRTLATHELVDRIGSPAVEPLKKLLAANDTSARARIHALWALERLGGLDSSMTDKLAHDADRGVRTHVMKMLAERAESDLPLALAALQDPDALVRRAAAEVLARHPRLDNVQPLLKLWSASTSDDTHLIHVARMALRDQLAAAGVYARIARLPDIDQPALERLADVSLGLESPESADFVWEQLKANPDGASRDARLHHVARHIAADKLSDVYAFALSSNGVEPTLQAATLRAIARGSQERGAKLPREISDWVAQLTSSTLASDHEGSVRLGVDLSREFNPPVFDALMQAATASARFPALRGAALEACATGDPRRATAILAQVLADAAEPANLRQQAATLLARVNNDDARRLLLANLPTAPHRLAVEIAAGLADSPVGAQELLNAIETGKATPRLLQERVVVSRLQVRNLDHFSDRLSKLTAGLPPEDARVRELVEKRRGLVTSGRADAIKGAAIFEKHCAICHRIGDRGAKVGPNLDGVGIRGIDRLLEDILDPNRNVDQAFRATQVVANGRILIGLALRDEGQVLVLADSAGKEVRVPASEIEERTLSPLSPMPANVPDLMSDGEFVDLVGYLFGQRERTASAGP